MDELITIDEAFAHYDRALHALPEHDVPLDAAYGRVLSRDVASRIDLPPFSQSAMDGYALRSEEVENATTARPVALHLEGTIFARGHVSPPRLSSGQAMRIFTGGYLPDGADAVLRQEDAHIEGERLLIDHALRSGADVRFRAEELRQGELLVQAGTRITSGFLGAMAAAGAARVRVHRQPRIALLVTGDEVAAQGQPLACGETYDANTLLVSGWLRSQGCSSISTFHLCDDLKRTETALQEALAHCDLVLTTGGVSVGDRDYVLQAAGNAGVKRAFWKVKQRPGKALFFGTRGNAALLGLPGNPGAVFTCLWTHVRRALDRLEGLAVPGPHFFEGRLKSAVRLNPKSETWLRCRVDLLEGGEAWLTPLSQQASHAISQLGECTALARIPSGAGELAASSRVLWISTVAAWQGHGEEQGHHEPSVACCDERLPI